MAVTAPRVTERTRKQRERRVLRRANPTIVPRRPSAFLTNYGPRLPTAPIHDWLKKLIGVESWRGESLGADQISLSSHGAVCAHINRSPRRLYDYLRADWLFESTLDWICLHEGSTTVDEIYRNYRPSQRTSAGCGIRSLRCVDMKIRPWGYGKRALVVYQWEPEREDRYEVKTMTKARTCRWGAGCSEDPGEKSRFCTEHAAILAGVKVEYEEDTFKKKKKNGKLKDARSTCCRPGCFSPRLAVERYCDKCYDDGWREEDIE